jgi:hypothetical protein
MGRATLAKTSAVPAPMYFLIYFLRADPDVIGIHRRGESAEAD